MDGWPKLSGVALSVRRKSVVEVNVVAGAACVTILRVCVFTEIHCSLAALSHKDWKINYYFNGIFFLVYGRK